MHGAMQGHCTCIWKEGSLTLFLHCPLLLPAKRSSCLTICPFLYHESLTMSESIDKVLFTTVFDCWFVTLKYHFLYFLSWATHNIPALPPHLHSWVVGLCYSQTILTTPFYFTVCRFHVAAISIFSSQTCFLLDLFFRVSLAACARERNAVCCSVLLARGHLEPEEVVNIHHKNPTSGTCILRSSNSGFSFPVSPCPRWIPVLWYGRPGSVSASGTRCGSTGRREKTLRQGFLWGDVGMRGKPGNTYFLHFNVVLSSLLRHIFLEALIFEDSS